MAKQSSGLQNLVALVGRVLISIVFIVSGIEKIINYQSLATQFTQTGMGSAHLLLILSIIFELGGAILVFLGFFTRLGALLLLIFSIAATFGFPFLWVFQGVKIAHLPFIQPWGDSWVGVLPFWGIFLYLIAVGADAISIDLRRNKA